MYVTGSKEGYVIVPVTVKQSTPFMSARILVHPPTDALPVLSLGFHTVRTLTVVIRLKYKTT